MLIGVNCIKLFTQLSFDLRSSKMDSKNYNDSLAISQDHDGILQITVTAIKVQPHQDSMLLTNIMEVLSKWLNLAKNYHETA